MHPFEETISIVGPVVGGIIALAIFFKLLNKTASSSDSPTRIAFKGVLDDETLATVHVTGGKTFEDVRLIGFTDSSSVKGPFPYELNGMVILEHRDGRRTMIQAKSIRMIEVARKPG
ncbi:MAG: hypothetical protein AAGE65_10410 [Planctomycetota bacterium]